jgi:glutamine amidotransferase
MIALVDYGLGNINAFASIYHSLGIAFCVARTARDLRESTGIILPGVGSFDWAITRLRESGLCDVLDEQVLGFKKPILGVCVGMQMMARASEEGLLPGLGWVDAEVKKLLPEALEHDTHLPHMGWNDVVPVEFNQLFKGIMSPRYYFLHSYYFSPARKEDIIARTSYGITFASAIRSENIYGVQFHPEKSHHWGIELLKNFSEIH